MRALCGTRGTGYTVRRTEPRTWKRATPLLSSGRYWVPALAASFISRRPAAPLAHVPRGVPLGLPGAACLDDRPREVRQGPGQAEELNEERHRLHLPSHGGRRPRCGAAVRRTMVARSRVVRAAQKRSEVGSACQRRSPICRALRDTARDTKKVGRLLPLPTWCFTGGR